MAYGFLIGLLCGLSFWLADIRLQVRSDRRRRGGWLKPPASVTMRTPDDGTTPISSRSPLGGASAAEATHPTLDPWSRRVVPIGYGSPLDTVGGETGPTRPGSATFDSYRAPGVLGPGSREPGEVA